MKFRYEVQITRRPNETKLIEAKPEEFTLDGQRYRVVHKQVVTQYTDKGSFKFTVTIVEAI